MSSVTIAYEVQYREAFLDRETVQNRWAVSTVTRDKTRFYLKFAA